MNQPELTLVLPMYNVEQYIERCLASIYCQPEAACVEVILVNDDSPDRSAEIAKHWLENNTKHKNWYIINQENRGLGGARNTGLREAKGVYVWFIDTDDEITTNSLQIIIDKLHEDADIFTFNHKTHPNRIVANPTTKITNIQAHKLFSQVDIVCVPFNVYKKSFLDSHKLEFRERFLHEDNEFLVRLISKRPNMSYYPDITYIYHYRNSGSINNTVSLKSQIDRLAHLDSCETTIRRTSDLPTEVTSVMYLTCGIIVSIVLKRSLQLNKQDWFAFKEILLNHKPLITATHAHLPFRYRAFNLLLSKWPNKNFYKVAFMFQNNISRIKKQLTHFIPQ